MPATASVRLLPEVDHGAGAIHAASGISFARDWALIHAGHAAVTYQPGQVVSRRCENRRE